MCVIGSAALAIGYAVLFNKRRAAKRNTDSDRDNETVSDRAKSTSARAECAADRVSEIIRQVKESQ